MKDSQGTNIINPETMKIIRNLHQKANHEGKDREFYINQFLTDNILKMQGITKMEALERYGQAWCIKQGILGYEYICGINTIKLEKESK